MPEGYVCPTCRKAPDMNLEITDCIGKKNGGLIFRCNHWELVQCKGIMEVPANELSDEKLQFLAEQECST